MKSPTSPLSPSNNNNNQQQPKWRNIRYEQIGDGSVSTTSTTALFCKTLASFGLPSTPANHQTHNSILTSQSVSSSSSTGTNTNNSKQNERRELWTRFKFNMAPTMMSSHHASGAGGGGAGGGNPARYYGEQAVVGAEIRLLMNNGSNSNSNSASPLLHLLLRNDGILCLKKGQQQQQAQSNMMIRSDDTFEALLQNELFNSSCSNSMLQPPTVALLKKGGAMCHVPLAHHQENSSSPDDHQNHHHHSYHLPPCCIFSPGSTVLVRSSISFSSCIVVEWLIFCAPSIGFSSGTVDNQNQQEEGIPSEAVLVTMTIPVSMSTTNGLSLESLVSVDAVAGQSGNLLTSGNRPPSSSMMMMSNNNNTNENELSSAEFVADFVSCASRDFLMRAPALMLSNQTCSDLSSFLNHHQHQQSSSSPSDFQSPSSMMINTQNNNNIKPPYQPSSGSPSSLGSSMNSSVSSPLASSSIMQATNRNILSEGFSNSDVLRLATSSATRKSEVSQQRIGRNVIVGSSHPSYVDLRAEKCFAQLEKLVDSF